MMCPQLFINYKLKSVAHMPWRQMTYKFLNTIIDDLFAFVIKMPILHRLSVFRDGEFTYYQNLCLRASILLQVGSELDLPIYLTRLQLHVIRFLCPSVVYYYSCFEFVSRFHVHPCISKESTH